MKQRLHEIIFEADTPAGKAFDVALLIAILSSIAVVMLESVKEINDQYGTLLNQLEWFFTILFTIEYILRIYLTHKSIKYITSFYGIIDFLSILPNFLGIFISGSGSLIVIRSFRLLRVFRVLKLVQFIGEAQLLTKAIKASGYKISVFLITVITFTIIFGTIMYQVEGPENGFTSIPKSIYWAIVTLTTVGYGDLAPQTVLGQTLSSIIMILGYGIIAVPTGLVSAELVRSNAQEHNTQVCQNCSEDQHDNNAKYCKTCGFKL